MEEHFRYSSCLICEELNYVIKLNNTIQYEFPTNPFYFKKWSEAILEQYPNAVISKSSTKICSLHFPADAFDGKRLKTTAIPVVKTRSAKFQYPKREIKISDPKRPIVKIVSAKVRDPSFLIYVGPNDVCEKNPLEGFVVPLETVTIVNSEMNPSKHKCLVCHLLKTWNIVLKPDENVSYHSFPTDEKKLKIWEQKITAKFPKAVIDTNLSVCSLHFPKSDFVIATDNSKVLKFSAIPVINAFNYYHKTKPERLAPGTLKNTEKVTSDAAIEIISDESEVEVDAVPTKENPRENLSKDMNIKSPKIVTTKKNKLLLKRQNKHKCDICDYSTCKAIRLSSHMRKHKQLRNGQEVFGCLLCKKQYLYKFDLKVHLVTHAEKIMENVLSSDSEEENKDAPKSKKVKGKVKEVILQANEDKILRLCPKTASNDDPEVPPIPSNLKIQPKPPPIKKKLIVTSQISKNIEKSIIISDDGHSRLEKVDYPMDDISIANHCYHCGRNYATKLGLLNHQYKVHGIALPPAQEITEQRSAKSTDSTLEPVLSKSSAAKKHLSQHHSKNLIALNDEGVSFETLFCRICRSSVPYAKKDSLAVSFPAENIYDTRFLNYCDMCDLMYTSKTALFYHRYKVHGLVLPEIETRSQKTADTMLSKARADKKHITKVLNNREIPTVKISEIDKNFGLETNFCDICDQMYNTSKLGLQHHRFKEHGVPMSTEFSEHKISDGNESNIFPVVEEQPTIVMTKPIEEDGNESDVWPMEDNFPAKLIDLHIYGCEHCNKQYHSDLGYTRHLSLKHSIIVDVPTYYCDQCWYQARTLDLLRMHYVTYHVNGELKHECSRCHAKFKHELLLLEHFKKHRTKCPRPFVQKFCLFCKLHFITKEEFDQHNRNHRDDFECPLCGAARNTRKRAINHHRLCKQGVLKCDKCDYKSRWRSGMCSHKQIHHNTTNQKRKYYPCGKCKKLFTSVGQRNIHQNLHTGAKPYKCIICILCFADPSTLRKHKKTHLPKVTIDNKTAQKRITRTRKKTKIAKAVLAEPLDDILEEQVETKKKTLSLTDEDYLTEWLEEWLEDDES